MGGRSRPPQPQPRRSGPAARAAPPALVCRGHADVQRAPIRSSEDAHDRYFAREVDGVGQLPARQEADDPRPDGVGDPDGTGSIQADSVRAARTRDRPEQRNRGEDHALRQGASDPMVNLESWNTLLSARIRVRPSSVSRRARWVRRDHRRRSRNSHRARCRGVAPDAYRHRDRWDPYPCRPRTPGRQRRRSCH